MGSVLAVFIDGLIYASWLFMTAAGLTIIYGVMRILNMAHGSLYALGAYATASAVGAYLRGGYPPLGSYAVLLLAAIAVGLVMGPLIERGLLRFLYGRDEVRRRHRARRGRGGPRLALGHLRHALRQAPPRRHPRPRGERRARSGRAGRLLHGLRGAAARSPPLRGTLEGGANAGRPPAERGAATRPDQRGVRGAAAGVAVRQVLLPQT